MSSRAVVGAWRRRQPWRWLVRSLTPPICRRVIGQLGTHLHYAAAQTNTHYQPIWHYTICHLVRKLRDSSESNVNSVNVIPPRQSAARIAAIESAGVAKETRNKIYHRRCLATISLRGKVGAEFKNLYIQSSREPHQGGTCCDPGRQYSLNTKSSWQGAFRNCSNMLCDSYWSQ